MTFLILKLYIVLYTRLALAHITYARRLTGIQLMRWRFEAGMWLAHALLTLSEQLFHFRRPPGRIRYHIAYWLLDLSTAVANSFGRRCGLLK